MSLGEDILNHYQLYLGEYINAEVYSDSQHNIQLLGYTNVFENCLTFASFGLSNYSDSIANSCEVVMAVDDDYDNCASVFMNALFFVMKEKMQFGRGTLIEGIEHISKEFTKLHNKSALFFTHTYIFPDNFSEVSEKCKLYMAFFVTENEAEYIRKFGCEQFEDLLEKKNCDIIDVNRASVV